MFIYTLGLDLKVAILSQWKEARRGQGAFKQQQKQKQIHKSAFQQEATLSSSIMTLNSHSKTQGKAQGGIQELWYGQYQFLHLVTESQRSSYQLLSLYLLMGHSRHCLKNSSQNSTIYLKSRHFMQSPYAPNPYK